MRLGTSIGLALTVLSALASVAMAEEIASLTLDEAVRLALRGNESVQIARQDQAKAEGAVTEVRAGALPRLSLAGTYQGNFKKPAFFAPEEFGGGIIEMGDDIEVAGQLRVDQVLYAFGRVGKAIEYAGIYREMAGRGLQAARAQVAFEAREVYFRVLFMEQVLDIQKKSVEQLRAQLDVVRQKQEQGSASRFELLRAEVELKNALPDLIRAENDLALTRQDFCRVLGLPEGSQPLLIDELAYLPGGAGADEAIRAALSARPEIQALELNVEGAEKLLAIRKAGVLPTLGLYGQVLFQGASDADGPFDSFKKDNRAISTSAGLALQVPLFDGLATRGQVKQARADLRRSRYELEQARRGLRLEATKAVQELEGLRREYESREATVALAEEANAIARTRYDNGLSTLLELSDARLALDMARTGLAKTLYQYNVALADLDRVMGRGCPDDLNSEKE